LPEVSNIVVIDSGFGGLGVVAALDPSPGKGPGSLPEAPTLRITYINASPSDEVGFNQLPSHQHKVRTLEAVVARAIEKEQPAGVFIACNTLSVLLPDTRLASAVSVHGIPDVGARLLADFLQQHPEHPVLLFGTQTTISTDLYRQRVETLGQDPSRISQVACPRLETLISNDPTGASVLAAARDFAADGLGQMGHPPKLGVFLGCAHYGYRASVFRDVLSELGSEATVLNPNPAFAAHIRREVGAPFEAIAVRFLTPYVPPDGELANVPRLLDPLSATTAAAVRSFELDEGAAS